MNFPLFIARRIYGKGAGSQKVAKPAIRIATAGVAIGLAVMIVTVSVILGFKHTIRDKVVGFGSHITVANIASLIDVARTHRPGLSAAPGAESHLKVYVREASELARVDALLADALPDVPRLVLHARVCRRELRLEIDGAHG